MNTPNDIVIIKYNKEESLKIYKKFKKNCDNGSVKNNDNNKIMLDLTFSNAPGIIDCKYLQKMNIYSLNLSYIQQLRNTNIIMDVVQLNISSSNHLDHMSFINNDKLKKLTTNSNSKKLNLQKFKNLESLSISGCNELNDISNLTKLKELNIINCKKIKDIGNLREIKILKIDKPVYGFHFLKNLEEITIPSKVIKHQFYVKLSRTNKKIKII